MALEKALRPLASTLVRKVGEQAARGKPFYSPVDQAIANITQGKGTGAQMLAELMKTKGVAKELKDRPAIKKALEQPKVTKQELEQVAAENPPPQVQHRESDTTEYEQWQMPGGENRRNILLRLPNPAAERNADLSNQIRNLYQGIGYQNERMAKFPHLSVDAIPSIAHSEQEIARLRKELAALPRTPDMYESGHFDEKNILAHARVADYYDKGKKILLIDEIQSDWHQAARDARKNEIKRLMKAEGIDKATASERVPQDFGYLKEGESPRLTGEPFQLPDGTYGVRWSDGTTADLGWGKAEAQRIAAEGKQGQKLPDAPFKQNWHELVIKRLLDDAARNGYDKVVITPGAEQAKRYDLSKQISKIEYEPIGTSGQYEFVAFNKAGVPVIEEDEIPLSRIEELVGKGLAKKIEADEGAKVGGGYRDWREIAGVDLNVGGEGMTGFYDQIVPSYLNDYGKKYGVTVGTHDLVVPRKNPLRDIQEAVDEGYITAEEAAEMNPYQRRMFINQFQTRVNPVHSFDITPQMREDITTKGMPLYQVAPPVAIGAGAAMQEEEPAEYGKGGTVKRVINAVLPKGQQAVLPAAESVANLEKFLAGSAVKDRLYHGTKNSIQSFDLSKRGSSDISSVGGGVYLTPSPNLASFYSKIVPGESGANVMPLHAQVKNPYEYDLAMPFKSQEDSNRFSKRLQEAGYDSIVKRGQDGEIVELVVFDPNKIKSAIGNRGTYDINEADINKAKGGQVSKDAMWMAVQNKQIKKRAEGGAVHMAKGGALMRMKNRMTAEPFAKPSIVKEPGGNWLMGSVEQALKPLKVGPEDPRLDVHMVRDQTAPGGFRAVQNPPDPINQWIDRNLTNYIKKQMATPEDPVRKLAEQGIVHMPPEQMGLNATESNANRVRERLGTPRLGRSPEAQAWEDATDVAINPLTIKDVRESRKVGMPWAEWAFEPWMKEADPQTKIFRPTDNMGARYLGFDHIVDELKNAINPLSGLPRELQIKPESLSKLSMSQAVERVAKINAWREAQKAEANAALAMNPATVIHREYPTIPGTELPNERGLRWVEMRAPEELPAGWREETREGRQWFFDPEGKAHNVDSDPRYASLQDALKYEGETMGHCVGGYCPDVASGKTRIYSLRDAKGQPHVTIEVQPNKTLPRWDDVRPYLSVAEEEAKKLPNGYTDQDISNIATEMAKKAMPSSIVQIKGKANRKPNEEYLPFVQDFVRSGQWSDVGDIQNTGMRAKSSVFSDQELARLQEAGEADIPHILTGEEIQRLHNMIVPEGKRLKYDAAGNIIGDEAGYAKGGAVSCDCDHDAMQFAVWDKQLRKKHGN